MQEEKWHDALRFAAKFPRLGEHRDAILRAKDALNNPDFYKQIGKNPDLLISLGKSALIEKYS